jgi:hypothetical protein
MRGVSAELRVRASVRTLIYVEACVRLSADRDIYIHRSLTYIGLLPAAAALVVN